MSRLLTAEEAQEFKQILRDYSLREDGLAQFEASNFAVIAGPAGAGKDTLRDGLIEKYSQTYLPVLSTTTRPPREGEQDGITYHFRDVEAVREGLRYRDFFQAELVHDQQISCLDIGEINKLRLGQWGLSILIPETERKLSLIKPDIKTIFLVPPNLNLLMSRMQAERMLGDEEVSRRLDAARNELEYALETPHYYCLVSDTVENVVNRAHIYLQYDNRDEQAEQEAHMAARVIVDALNDW